MTTQEIEELINSDEYQTELKNQLRICRNALSRRGYRRTVLTRLSDKGLLDDATVCTKHIIDCLYLRCTLSRQERDFIKHLTSVTYATMLDNKLD